METSIQNYFWLVDRLQMEDDSRNKVMVKHDKVQLCDEFAQQLKTGQLIGQLLIKMQPTFSMRTGEQLEIDQRIASLSQYQQQLDFDIDPWQLVAQEMTKFGLQLSDAQLERLSQEDTKTLETVISGLFDIDNSPGDPNINQGNLSSKREVKSPTQNLNPLKGLIGKQGLISHRKSVGKLQPIEKEHSLRKSVNESDLKRSRSPILRKGEVRVKNKDTNRVLALEMPQSLEDTNSSAQFILRSIMTAFDMHANQAAGVLSDNSKYLYHMCVRGMKGGDFTRIQEWYMLIQSQASRLIELIHEEIINKGRVVQGKMNNYGPHRTLMKTFNILKGGFHSVDERTVYCCGELFKHLIIHINIYQDEIVGQTWEWLTSISNRPQSEAQSEQLRQSYDNPLPKQSQKLQKKPPRGKGQKQPNQESENEFLWILQQDGLSDIMQAMETFESCNEVCSHLLLHLGKFNAVELFTQHILEKQKSWSDYLQLSYSFLNALNSEIGFEVIENGGVLSFWIIQSLKVAETHEEIPLNDRIQSLIYLTEIWVTRADFIEDFMPQSSSQILNILKRAARDVKQTLSIISLELLFRLLESFAQIKNKFAPMIYKALSFILVEFYWELSTREIMLKHFIYLFQRNDNIPIAILCEPLFKQVQISQFETSSFNVFDFEFFQVVAYHKRLTLPVAILLMDALSKIAITSIFYQKVAINILKAMIMRFTKHQEMFDHWKTSFAQIVATLVITETNLIHHNIWIEDEASRVKQNKNKLLVKSFLKYRQLYPKALPEWKLQEAEVVAVKTSQRLIVNFLERISMLGNDLLNDELRNHLIEGFVTIDNQFELKSKPFIYLLQKFGSDVEAMVNQKLQEDIAIAQPALQNHIDLNYKHDEKKPMGIHHDPANDAQISDTTHQPRSEVINHKPEAHMLLNELNSYRNPQNNNNKQPVDVFGSVDNYLYNPYTNHQSDPIQIGSQGGPKSEIYNYYRQLKEHDFLDTPGKGKKQQGQLPPIAANKQGKSGVAGLRNLGRGQHRSQAVGGIAGASKRGSSVQRGISENRGVGDLSLYDYTKIDSQTDVLQLREHQKTHLKLFKEIFSRYSTNEEKSHFINLGTFDALDKKKYIINPANLQRMVKELDLASSVGFHDSLKLRNDIPALVRRINREFFGDKQTILSFEGFNEFLIQFAYRIFFDDQQPQKAFELLEKLIRSIEVVNKEKNLLIPKKYFVNNRTEFTEEDFELLDLLNEKIIEDPDFAIPIGFKKDKEVKFVNDYVVPDFVDMQQNEKVALEILDEIVHKAVGVHVLVPVPVRKEVPIVKLDFQSRENIEKAQREMRIEQRKKQQQQLLQSPRALYGSSSLSQSQLMSPHNQEKLTTLPRGNTSHSRQDVVSMLSGGVPTFSPLYQQQPGFRRKGSASKRILSSSSLSPNKRMGAASGYRLGGEIKLAVIAARPEDQMLYYEVGGVMEEMLGALERGQRSVNLEEPDYFYEPNHSQKQKEFDINRLSQKYPRTRVLKRQEEEEIQRKQKELEELDPEIKLRRKAILKQSLERRAIEIKQLQAQKEEEKEKQKQDREKSEMLRKKAEEARVKQIEKQKYFIQSEKERKEKQKQKEKDQDEEAKRQQQKLANKKLKENQERIQEEIKRKKEHGLKLQKDKEELQKKQLELPKRPNIDYSAGANDYRKEKDQVKEQKEKELLQSVQSNRRPTKQQKQQQSVRSNSKNQAAAGK